MITQQTQWCLNLSRQLSDFEPQGDLTAPYLWSQKAGTENKFEQFMQINNLTENELAMHISNKMAYLR